MSYCHTYLETFHFSCYGLDPETPDTDYEIHFVRAQDPGYLPPDSEAWPLYYQAALEAIRSFPGAFEATVKAVTALCERLKGSRALPPQPIDSPRRPNEPKRPLPPIGKREYQRN